MGESRGCTPECRKVTGRACHCGACHISFTGLTAFDKHRVGDVEHRVCSEPGAVGLELNAHGLVGFPGGRPNYWNTDSTELGSP